MTLMQEDKILSGNSYIKANFMIVINKDPRTRIWERPPEDEILVDTTTAITK